MVKEILKKKFGCLNNVYLLIVMIIYFVKMFLILATKSTTNLKK